MTIHENVARNQNQALSALHHTHEAVLDIASPVLRATEPLWRLGRELPMADRLPSAREVIEQWYGFFDGVLREEKEFLLSMEQLVPGRPMRPPAVKATPAKAA